MFARNCNLHVYKPLLHVMRLLFIVCLAVSRPARALVRPGLAPDPLGLVIIKPKFSRCGDNWACNREQQSPWRGASERNPVERLIFLEFIVARIHHGDFLFAWHDPVVDGWFCFWEGLQWLSWIELWLNVEEVSWMG